MHTWQQLDLEKLGQNPEPSICYLKLFALTAGVLSWEFRLRNMHLLVHCDNMGVVEMINKNTSSCKFCIFFVNSDSNGLMFNRKLMAVYMKSSANILSDSLL